MKPRFPALPGAAAPRASRAETRKPPAVPPLTLRHWLIAALLLSLYAALALWRADRPGLHYDEASSASLAYKTLHPDTPWRLPYGRPVGVGSDFVGPLKAYLTAPWLMLFPLETWSLRLLGALTGLAALAMTFALMGRWFGPAAGWTTLGLLAVDPGFILQTRSDMRMNGLMLCIRLGSLWALDRVWSKRSWSHGLLLLALTAAGLWTTGEHFWFLGGLLAAAAVVARKEWWGHLRENVWLLWVALPLAGWAVFFMYANAVSPEPLAPDFFERLRRVVTEQRFDEVARRLRLVGNTFNANAVESFYLKTPLGERWLPFWELLAFSVAVFLRGAVKPRAFFLLCLPYFSLLFLALTPPVHAPHHVMSVYPFLHMFVGAALSALPAGWWRRAALGLLLFYAVGAGREFLAFQRAFAAGKEHPKWSASIAEAAAFLREAGRPAACLDWGLGHNLAVLTQGKVPVREVRYDRQKGFQTDERDAVWPGLFQDRDTLFVLHAERHEVFPGTRGGFFALAGAAGRRPRLAGVVRHAGEPFIEFYEAVP